MPISLVALRTRYHTQLPAAELVRAMSLDKKGRAGRPRFVVPRAPGELTLGLELDESVLQDVLAAG